MKSRFARLAALFLTLVMLAAMLPVGAAAADTADYELRVLTFEDADYKGDTNFAGGSDWTTLIDKPQYMGPMLYPNGSGTTDINQAYTWYDSGNTELKHTLPKSWDNYCYWGGGHAVSNYVSGEFATYGGYDNQLTVYKKGVTGVQTSGGGHNDSNNFAVHFGYKDSSGYTDSQILPSFSFGDGSEHVIDHMYVNNICYALNCYLNGNDLTAKIGDDDWVKVVATGYNTAGSSTGTTEIYLCNGPDNIIMDWTKWDLSVLGSVSKVEFNILGSSDNGYGFSQPAYFAYDDVAVRFEKETAPAWDGTTITEPAQENGVYLIGTAEELGWFAMQSRKSGNYGISARLTADIDLCGVNWSDYVIASSTFYGNGFSGTFDGAGHTISGFYLEKAPKAGAAVSVGLIGFAANGTVKDLTIEGSIVIDMTGTTKKSSNYYIAPVIGYAKGTTIENVTSNVTVTHINDDDGYAQGRVAGIVASAVYLSETVEGSDSRVITNSVITGCVNLGSISGGAATGGIAARASAGTAIRNCLNAGSISSAHTDAGGILGTGEGATVESCVNTGSVSAAATAGGIVAGCAYSRITNAENPGEWSGIIRSCYNTGSVESRCDTTSRVLVGGIVGNCNGGSYTPEIKNIIENCYNVGAVTAANTGSSIYVGSVCGYVLISDANTLYGLEGTAENGYGYASSAVGYTAEIKTAEELKSAELLAALGSAFKKDAGSVNNGYPVLSWQVSEGADVVLGDVNGDGVVNAIDAAMVYACHNGKLELTEEQLSAADVTGDGTVNTLDAAKIYAFHNGKISSF